MDQILPFPVILLFVVVCTLVLLSKPLPLFGNRLNTAVVGLPLLLIIFGFFVGTAGTTNKPTATQVASQQTIPEAQTTKNPEKKTHDIANAGVIKIQQIESNQKVERTLIKYDPQSASDATGETIRNLDDHQRGIVTYAAQLVSLMKWCGYGGTDALMSVVKGFGVHSFDFKNYVTELKGPTVSYIKNNYPWQSFCETGIYAIYGPNGELFGKGGTYPNIAPWIVPLTVKPGMSKKKLEAEVTLTVAYYGAGRCDLEFDDKKEAAFKAKNGLDDDWYGSFDQNNALLNETFLRLGPKSLMDCTKFLRNYRRFLSVN